MKVLILGATGYIGRELFARLAKTDWAVPGRASRGRSSPSLLLEHPGIDSRNPKALASVLDRYDCVVNCVAGDFGSIASGARQLADAASRSRCRRIVHLSTMSVYGRSEGELTEDAPLDPGLGWYARAKCEAESSMRSYSRSGGELVILRPGCVYGAGSELWVGRVARWLRAQRVGDIGASGDGWSNLVHIDDVCLAVMGAIRLPIERQETRVFNLAAPDSPRWNRYLVDLAVGMGAVPVRRISMRRLQFDAGICGPPLKAVEKFLDRCGISHRWLPEPLPPSIVRLWRQEIRVNSEAAARILAIHWTEYAKGIAESTRWLLEWPT